MRFSPQNFPTVNLINEGDGNYNLGYAMKCSSARVLPESIYLILTFDDGVTKKISIKQTSTDHLDEQKEFYVFLSPIALDDLLYFKNHLLTSFHASLTGDDQLEGIITLPKSAGTIVSQTAACVTE
ncbi:hypothetical protein [Mucilaginibacter myungsuensis]|uniref:Uncharacterized protein n=1 Tax=Mucilaginibacter myungsuensis TaxID=649104 RepID=A0A929L2P2_9SPHI|nr:hypothetical protein [Mucilaginibacter myungsuensis]MBE9664538.1 hypothetical protein [Mucilaginibacter myungsuensis]